MDYPLNHTKQHEEEDQTNYLSRLFRVVSCGLADGSLFFVFSIVETTL